MYSELFQEMRSPGLPWFIRQNVAALGRVTGVTVLVFWSIHAQFTQADGRLTAEISLS